jgi:hypothetical protein
MKRRDAISYITFVTGGSLIVGHTFMAGCSPNSENTIAASGLLNAKQIKILDEIGDIILPTTASSPGAKAANIGEYMNVMITDCSGEEAQNIFLSGFDLLEKRCQDMFGNSFMELDSNDKYSVVVGLEDESSNYHDKRGDNDPRFHYYSMIKQLTMRGYFSSEIGATQALQHVAIPGRWDPCIPLEAGQKAYSA